MKKTVLILFSFLIAFVVNVNAQKNVLIKNANVFDGVNEQLLQGTDVLVENNLIKQIAKDITAPEGAEVIDAQGKTLIPGLIDAHWHTTYAYCPQSILAQGDILEVAIISMKGAEATLMRGFTSTRDMGGNPFAIKKLIDRGDFPGPRILPSGPPISQTSGHFDFRDKNATPVSPADPLDYWRRNMLLCLADGVPEMTKRTREILRAGATQLKLATGGGVSSTYDPLDVTEYTFEETKAAVDVANTWNTYVAAHVMTDAAIRMSLEAGVISIEHGFFASDETLELMKEKGAWLVPQPFLKSDLTFDNPASQEKYDRVCDAVDNVYKKAKQKGVNIGFGTDLLFDPEAAAMQGALLARLKQWFTPYEVMKMATSENGKVMALSGPRNTYQAGKLGVIEQGAYADIIIVDGNPLKNLDLVAEPDKNFVLIMKDGKIYKNTIK